MMPVPILPSCPGGGICANASVGRIAVAGSTNHARAHAAARSRSVRLPLATPASVSTVTLSNRCCARVRRTAFSPPSCAAGSMCCASGVNFAPAGSGS